MSYDFCAALANLTQKTAAELFGGRHPLVVIEQDGEGQFAITHWDESLGPRPDTAELVAAARAAAR